MVWNTIRWPGFSGEAKAHRHAAWDKEFGVGNWRVAWLWNGNVVDRGLAYQLYEDGYYADSFAREDVWRELLTAARDVYDIEPADVEAGFDYSVQKAIATHLQDISIRRVVLRRGWRFEGSNLVQIRDHSDFWGNLLSPGRVPFHLPALIKVPQLEGWWDLNSIEDFYQSNKVLQAR